MTYDFTKKELDFIIENANFTNKQKEIFDRLTDRKRKTKSSKNCNGNEFIRKNYLS